MLSLRFEFWVPITTFSAKKRNLIVVTLLDFLRSKFIFLKICSSVLTIIGILYTLLFFGMKNRRTHEQKI